MPNDRDDDIQDDAFIGMDDEGRVAAPGALMDPNAAEARMAQIEAAGIIGDPHDPDEDLFKDFAEDAAELDERDILDGAMAAAFGEGAPEAAAARPAEVVYRPAPFVAPAAPGPRAAPAIAGPEVRGNGADLVPAGGALANYDMDPRWQPLLELPGYRDGGPRGEATRSLGRAIFRQLPCFRDMEELCRPARRDPLGQVHVMTNKRGQESPALRQMSTWISERGLPLDSVNFEVFARMPGYDPQLRIALSEEDSYLLVEERKDHGCPSDETYIYSWRGGNAFYRAHPEEAEKLRRLAGRHLRGAVPAIGGAAPAQAPALPAPGQARPARPAVVPAVPAAQAPAARQPAPVAPAPVAPAVEPDAPLARAPRGAKPVDAAALAAAEAARPVQAPPPQRLAPMQAFRAAGFSTIGTASGPALRRTREDGAVEQVTSADVGAGGRPVGLALAKRFQVALLAGPDAEPTDTAEVADVDEAIGWLDDRRPGAAAPRR